ncbi:MAG: N-6 DNA methylase, partial [Nanoarchaeota archaeon]|nr:N-6 DNA methylase [Nanoarchaeota archaeon]
MIEEGRAITKDEAKREVAKLVTSFSKIPVEELNKKSEPDIKSKFIEPLLEALGWQKDDMELEARVLKGRADYILKLGNQEVLVVEAKRAGVDLGDEEGRQAVSYAYHRKIKFAVLTNFKQIRVYHALSNIKNITKNLLRDNKGYLVLNSYDFVNEFERLRILSRESFEKGEINKLLSAKDEKVFKPIDESILEDLLQFREWLSKDLKGVRMHLSPEQIDEIVQILIDRLIFMRSVEDRGLEDKDLLLKLTKDVEQGRTEKVLWGLLKDTFKAFDKTYNSKLFAEGLLEKEGFFDENTLKKVINGLYYGTKDNRERYMFDEIPGDLLGNIYEQYLGTVLRGSDKRVKLEEGTGKRKKMGIYYTPSYIVDYIVKNTVGEYIRNKTIDEILDTRIVDPACGSGSFLIRAFREVCDIAEKKLEKGERSTKWLVFKNYKGKLNLGQKMQLLTNCIYGVDLDEKAVELAQLNLLLRLLEDETKETRKQLPTLKDNIKCGNSLIDDLAVSDKAFSWRAQFPKVFAQGGFDVVVGNPPYIRIQTLDKKDIDYFSKNYASAIGNYDIYSLFVEKAVNLIKDLGK